MLLVVEKSGWLIAHAAGVSLYDREVNTDSFLKCSQRTDSRTRVATINFLLSSADIHGDGSFMIQLTRLNHLPLVLNSDLIEHIEITPDTVITLTSGHKIMVLEAADDVVARVVAFRRSILNGV